MDRDTLIGMVRAAGVVGAGGAGFPTHIKLSSPTDIIVVNGAECEPLIHVDIQLLCQFTETILDTLKQLLDTFGCQRGIVAFKGKYAYQNEQLARLGSDLNSSDPITALLLPDVYPMGDEQVLVYEATGRIIPSGGIPPSVGVTVLNIETLLNIGRALAGSPVLTKYVTVSGDTTNPGTFEVPIGTPAKELLDCAGGWPVKPGSIVVDGGPMMGRRITPDSVVTKTTKSILVLHPGRLSPNEVNLAALKRVGQNSAKSCSQCRSCTDICPRYQLGHDIEPHRLMRTLPFIDELFSGKAEGAVRLQTAFLCSECGLCEVVGCPFELSPRKVNIILKSVLRERGYRAYKGTGLPAPRDTRALAAVSSARVTRRLGIDVYGKPAPLRPLNTVVKEVKLPLPRVSTGPAFRILVTGGENVERGQLVAEPLPGYNGASIHASIAGTVSISDDSINVRG